MRSSGFYFCLAVVLGGLFELLSIGTPAQAADAAQFDEQLAAGEFTTALATAKQQADRATRDKMLAQVAAAQSSAGARSASLLTSSEIRDDQTRANTIDQLRREPMGAAGGGVQPDFDSLIALLTETVAPQSWAATGGQGAVKEFRGGVSVDTQGMMQRLQTETTGRLADARRDSAVRSSNSPLRSQSALRKVSLPRLERAIQRRVAEGKPLDDAMELLAGLQRIEYVFVYPETGDLVLAGPADAWQLDREGRIVGVTSGRPVVRLDDLLVLMRHLDKSPGGQFGCSITPTQEGLARTQAFAQESAARPLKPGERDAWLGKLRDHLGAQDITVSGIDPRTRAARVLVEADYRMKLVGIGLEPGTVNVPSYLDMLTSAKGAAPPMDVLRWWFTMNYDAVESDAQHEAYGWRGQGVRVLCENELLDPAGQRVHTDQANQWNREFARNFTQHFAALAAKYPIYAELQNVFDVALAVSVIQREQLDKRVGWEALCFRNEEQLPASYEPAPRKVQTVINHRVVNKVNIVAAISGGVTAEPAQASASLAVEKDGKLDARHKYIRPETIPTDRWWWD